MRYIFFTIVSFIIILTSCTINKNTEIIIPQDTMAMVLADVHMADATLSIIINHNKFKEIDDYYYTVIQKYNINRARLDSSISYYSSRGKEYADIYEEVMLILSKKEGATIAEKSENEEIKKIAKLEQVFTGKIDFENNKENFLLDNTSTIKANSGKASALFDYNTTKSKTIIYEIKYSISEFKLKLKADISFLSNKNKTYPKLIIIVYNHKEIEMKKSINLNEYIVKNQEWTTMNITNSISFGRTIEEGEVHMYIDNPYKNDFFIDNVELKLFVR